MPDFASSRRAICVSKSIRGMVLEEMGRICRTSVVYNGVDPEFFCPSDEVPSESPLILSFGNLLPIEGHELLAIAILLRDESLRRRLGMAARDTVLERLTLAHQTDSLARIYRESIA